MATGLEVFDAEGEVVEQIDGGSDDLDELEEFYSPRKAADEGGSETPSSAGKEEGEGEIAEAPDGGAEEAAAGEGEGEVAAPEKAEEGEQEESAFDAEEENRQLRALARDQRKELELLKARLNRLEKNMPPPDEDDEDAPQPELERVEQLQSVVQNIAQQRGPALEVLLEAMEQNPKYADVKTVCSQANLDFIISSAAETLAQREGRNPVEVALELEAGLWSEKNPYKTMYDLIKEHHPKYVKAAKAATPEVKKEAPAPEEPAAKKAPTPAKAPSSIADAGSGKPVSMGGWTASRIDEMDELELDKVPPEVYEKYLQGQLD